VTKICGIIGDLDANDLAARLRAIQGASAHKGCVARETWCEAPASLSHLGIGAVKPQPQPFQAADGSWTAVGCGKIFDYASLKASLAREGAEFSPDAGDVEFLAQLLRRRGPEALAQINGTFAIAIWDSAERSLTLATDRFGLRGLYYQHVAKTGAMAFSSDLRGVVAADLTPPEADWGALSVLLQLRYHLGEDTSFAGVRAMPPASVLRFADNSVHVKRYWDIGRIGIDESMTYAQAVEGCVERFAEAIRRRDVPTQGRTIVFLSGGLDSARIAAELKRQGREFTTYTTRGFHPWNKDGPPAKQIAQALGVKNTFVNLPSRGFLTECLPQVAKQVDYETDLHLPFLPLIGAVGDECKLCFDGLAGDITFNATRRVAGLNTEEGFEAALGMSAEALARRLVLQPVDPAVLTRRIRSRLSWEQAIARVAEELRRYEGTPNRVACFYLMNRSRRAVALAATKVFARKLESFLPFFDNDLFDFVMSIPPRMRVGNDLRRDVVQRAYPDLAEIFRPDRDVLRGDDIGYYRQRKQFVRHNLRKHFVGNNWLFDNRRAAGRALRDLLVSPLRKDHRSYLFNSSFLLLFHWLERYFPHGQGL
jgi:asparagine synthase (glutamine-hydrolysing)